MELWAGFREKRERARDSKRERERPADRGKLFSIEHNATLDNITYMKLRLESQNGLPLDTKALL